MIEIDYKKLIDSAVILSIANDRPFVRTIENLLYNMGIHIMDQDPYVEKIYEELDVMQNSFRVNKDGT